ncbi:MAG: FAD-dependent monooxygenase [Burkholderiaceae bacterium]
MPAHSNFDVAIVGAGPAGCLCAILLARAGLRVALIGEPGSERRIEGVSARTLKILADTGLRAHGLLGQGPRRAHWPGLAGTVGDEALVMRPRFDAGLRADAVAAGVQALAAVVRGRGERAWFSDRGPIGAALLIDARGRRAPVAADRRRAPVAIAIAGGGQGQLARTRPSRRSRDDPAAVAYATSSVPSATMTRATPLGWCWQAEWGRRAHWTQMVVDASEFGQPRGGGGSEFGQPRGGGGSEFGRPMGGGASEFGQPAGGGASEFDQPRGGAAAIWRRFFEQPEAGGFVPMPRHWRARAASIQLNPYSLVAGDPMRIGDAAVAFDPLSGHGLFWALASARMAVPAVLASLDGQLALADRFLSRRSRETFLRQARIGRDFHRLAASEFATAYWSSRCEWPDSQAAHPPSTGPRCEHRVIVHDGRLREAEVLHTMQEPDGVAFVRGLEIAPLARRLWARPTDDAGRVLAQALPGADSELRSFLLGWLLSRGVIADSPGHDPGH